MKRFLSILLLLVSACGSVPPASSCEGAFSGSQENVYCGLKPSYTVGWSVTSSEQDVEQLTQAIDFWNAGLGFNLFVAGGENSSFLVTINPSTNQQDDGHTDRWKGSNRAIGCFITLKPGQMWWLYSHELGHCIGFEHVLDEHSVMNKITDENVVVTPEIKEIVFNLLLGP